MSFQVNNQHKKASVNHTKMFAKDMMLRRNSHEKTAAITGMSMLQN